jgi:tetratricopeptide (TPR) repeat protein
MYQGRVLLLDLAFLSDLDRSFFMRLRPGLLAVLLSAAVPAAIAQTAAPANQNPAPNQPASNQPAPTPDRAASYYHYSLAHNYEELATLYGRSEYVTRAIEEYKLAIASDPTSEYLNAGLAELYARTNRIKDAVTEAQNILKRDPNNIEARKLLGRIYLRSLGDLQAGTQSNEVLKLAIEQYEAITKLDPKSVDNYLLLGRLYILHKDLLKAENSFKTALKMQPTSEEAITNLAYLYNEEGSTQKAVYLLAQTADQAGSAKVYAMMGYTYEQQKDYKKAIAAYRKATEIDPDNLDAQRGLAQNLLSAGDMDGALRQYQAVVKEDPQDAQSLVRIAEIHRRNGRFDDALATLKQAEGLVQDSIELNYNYALTYAGQGKYDEAIAQLQGLLQKSEKPGGQYTAGELNNRAVFIERMGTFYRDQGKIQEAVDTFKRLLSMGDENAIRGYQQLVDTLRDAKRYAESEAMLKEAVAKFPNDRSLKLVYAGSLADNGKPEAAIQSAKALLKGNPKDDREVYLAIAQIYNRLRLFKDAETAAAEAERLSTTDEEREGVASIQGSIFERQKKYDQAEERFKRALAGDPQNAFVLNYFGYMLADRGVRLQEALGMVKKAVDLDPQNAAYLDSLGWAYFKLGDNDLAEEYLRKALLRNPNDSTMQDHLAEVYAKQGKLKQAVGLWERAIAEWNRTLPADVDPADVSRVQKKLESTRVKVAKQQRD